MALVVIVGPTASGKTSASLDIAEEMGAFIVSADSRSIYKEMNIGTAKPSLEERRGIPHWGFDLVSPGDRFSVAGFKAGAESIIKPRQEKGEHSVMVGGTGLYIDSVVLDYTFPKDRGLFSPYEVEQMNKVELLKYYKKYNIDLPKDYQNLRRLQSGLLRDFSQSKRRSEPIENTIVVGISTDRDILKDRIRGRINEMFSLGVVEETIYVMNKYSIDDAKLPGNVYPIIARYIKNELNLEEAKQQIYTADWRLAKRQHTWFNRSKFIKWLPASEVTGFVRGEIKDL